MDFGPAFAALIGGLFGALIGKMVDYYLSSKVSEKKRDAGAQIVADALRGEIKALRDEMSTYYAPLSRLLELNPKTLDQSVVRAELYQPALITTHAPIGGVRWS